jgi:hypothetical protein
MDIHLISCAIYFYMKIHYFRNPIKLDLNLMLGVGYTGPIQNKTDNVTHSHKTINRHSLHVHICTYNMKIVSIHLHD